MKVTHDYSQSLSTKDLLDVMAIRAREVERLVYDLTATCEVWHNDQVVVEQASQHLLHCLEVLKGLKFGRA